MVVSLLNKVFLFIAVSFFPVLCFADLNAEQILAKADEIRSPQQDFKVLVDIINKYPDKEDKSAKYEVLIKGKDNTVIKTLYPNLDRGTSLLMNHYDLWVFLPSISKPLRISMQQRLFGEAANGDIARINFSYDYTPKLLKTEKINTENYYVLELLAKNERVTYQKVILWVQTDNFHPLKAEFYAFSGRLLKTCDYKNYKYVLGCLRPTRLILDNPLKRGQKSIIEYSDMIITELPDKIFTKNYLKKLRY